MPARYSKTFRSGTPEYPTPRLLVERMVTEFEVARVALFLVSDLSSGVTGQTINVDAGSIMN